MVVSPHVKSYALSTDCVMNFSSVVTATFIHGNTHKKLLKLLEVFKRCSLPLLRAYTSLHNAERHTTVNVGHQVQTGHVQQEVSTCTPSSSCAVQILQLISYPRSVMPAEVP